MEEINGCLWIWESDKDYVLCNWDSDLLPTLIKKDEVRFEYNQYKYKWGYSSCTIFAAVWMASDLTNYKFSYDEIKEIDDTSYDNPDYEHIRRRWEWWYVSDAVNHIRKRWNKNDELVKKYWKLASYRISKYNDEIIEDAINSLYTIDWNYCPTTEYNKDREDLMIEWTNFWYKTNWHSVDIICKDGQRSVKDSWSRPERNIYWLKNKLSKITNYWPYFYIYTLVKEDNLWEIKRLNEIKAECNLLIEHLWKLYHLVNDTNFQWILHYTADKLRAKIDTCNEMLKKLQ
mgnify:CR=1 FL=1